MLPDNSSFFAYDSGAGDYVIQVDSAIYQLEAIQNAVHSYTCDFYVKMLTTVTGKIEIRFKVKKDLSRREDIESSLHEFSNTLIEYQIRFDLEKRFGNLREQVYQCAFAPITITE